ncbi:endonuclease III [Hyphococcus luteus]|uniref:endonuclease III n=1 Tax=Hyphococcus luteus TaxID=2058213 RepID=UPI001A9C6449|nr:endonuclease III [Marinicaulis flavus]
MPKMTRATARKIFERLSEARPAPKTELHYKNPFTLVVAVALSAQATDEGVNKATKTLFDVADTPEKMAALGEKKLGEYVKTIGLWRNKTKNVLALSQKLIDAFGGEVPQTREELESLPGVGRKTANVVLNVAFGQPTIAVDTHIFRVGNRTGLAPGKNPLEVELGLEKIIPDDFMQHAHHWLILHGRYICKARKPECWRCPIVDLCQFKEKVMSPDAPKKNGPKPAAKKKAAKKTAKKAAPKKKLAGKPKLRTAKKTAKKKAPAK